VFGAESGPGAFASCHYGRTMIDEVLNTDVTSIRNSEGLSNYSVEYLDRILTRSYYGEMSWFLLPTRTSACLLGRLTHGNVCPLITCSFYDAMYMLYTQGVNIGIYNPTFPSIEVMTSSNTAQISTTVIWIGLASGFGTLMFGWLFDETSGIPLLSACLLLEGLAVALTPTWPSLPAFQAVTALASVFNFAIMSGRQNFCYLLKTYIP